MKPQYDDIVADDVIGMEEGGHVQYYKVVNNTRRLDLKTGERTNHLTLLTTEGSEVYMDGPMNDKFPHKVHKRAEVGPNLLELFE